PLAASSEKASVEISQTNQVTVHQGSLQSMSPGKGLENRQRSVEHINTFGGDSPEHVVFFASKRNGCDDGMRSASKLAESLIQFGSQFVDCQARGRHVLGFQVTDASIGSDGHLSASKFWCSVEIERQDIARSQSKALLPVGALRRPNDGEPQVGPD